ncbi:MAG TPA: sensor histidine kinase [Burkholderiaceae bacterium]|nr:sensor histidine kinase [Burkholderiaceae bacterium]
MSSRPASLRSTLLLGILVPVVAVLAVGTVVLYRASLAAANAAYDRTLLASAKSIGEELRVERDGAGVRLIPNVPYSALEAFEADNRSRMYYRIAGFAGETVSGFADLPPPRPAREGTSPYPALVHFYDDVFRGDPVRMAVLLQPVAGRDGRGMATIQVAETLELRRTLAHDLLVRTLAQQALLLVLIAAVVVWVVQRATRPVRELSTLMRARGTEDLSPLPVDQAPRELRPVLDATNAVMDRLARLLEHQKRFVRDASHQLRTPLAVLKTQVQSAQRGDVGPAQAYEEIAATVERANELANQMLALAKVEQLRHAGDPPVNDWSAVVREVALDVAPLAAQRRLDLDVILQPAQVRGHAWALREMLRNLLHNAIRHSPEGGRLMLRLDTDARTAALTVSDSGPGLGEDLRRSLFQPFATGDPSVGAGLGLAICREIVDSLAGQIELANREAGGRVAGLDVVVRLPRVS